MMPEPLLLTPRGCPLSLQTWSPSPWHLPPPQLTWAPSSLSPPITPPLEPALSPAGTPAREPPSHPAWVLVLCDLPGAAPRGALQRSLCFLPYRGRVTGALPLLLDLDRQPVLERWDSGEEDGASEEEFPELYGPFRSEQGDPVPQAWQPPQSTTPALWDPGGKRRWQ